MQLAATFRRPQVQPIDSNVMPAQELLHSPHSAPAASRLAISSSLTLLFSFCRDEVETTDRRCQKRTSHLFTAATGGERDSETSR